MGLPSDQAKGPMCQDSQASKGHTVSWQPVVLGAGVSGPVVCLELCAEAAEGAMSSFLLYVRLGHLASALSSLSPQ